MSQCMYRVQTTTFRSQLSPIMWIPESEARLSGLGASIFTWYAISQPKTLIVWFLNMIETMPTVQKKLSSHPRYQKSGKDWFSIWDSAWCTRKLHSSWMREWTLRCIFSVFMASFSAWPTLPKVKLSMHDLKSELQNLMQVGEVEEPTASIFSLELSSNLTTEALMGCYYWLLNWGIRQAGKHTLMRTSNGKISTFPALALALCLTRVIDSRITHWLFVT